MNALSQTKSDSIHTVDSPDGEIEFAFRIHDGNPVYAAKYRGKSVADWSRMGLETASESAGWSRAEFEQGEFDREWEPVFGKRSPVRNRYNWLHVTQPKEDYRTSGSTTTVSPSDTASILRTAV